VPQGLSDPRHFRNRRGDAAEGAVAAKPGTGKIKLLVVLNGGHDGNGFTAVLTEVLKKTAGFDVTSTDRRDDLKADHLKKFDVVLIYGSGGDFTDPAQEQGLAEFARGGGGVVGVHATDANKKSDVYWELLGGRFAGHGGGTYAAYVCDKDHPITAGMSDFQISDETYWHDYHRNACTRCLVRMNQGNDRQCMAWVQHYGKGRVFNTGFGDNRAAWTNPQFQRLVVRATYWAAGRQPKDP
jgi:type 1 glutamine amidotransferase